MVRLAFCGSILLSGLLRLCVAQRGPSCEMSFSEMHMLNHPEAVCGERHIEDSNFIELDKLLSEAASSHLESAHKSVYDTVVAVVEHLFPCETLEFGVGLILPGRLVGRRRREETADRFSQYTPERLAIILRQLRAETNIACVKLLVIRHIDIATRVWLQEHSQQSSQTTLYTTTSTETATQSTTVTPESVTFPPIRRWNCSGLECLLYPDSHTGQLCPADQTFCMVSITDQSNDRHIDRSCASASMCDSLFLAETLSNADCLDVERRILPSSTKYYFCCVGDNCNRAPTFVPEVTSLYKRP